MPRFVLLYHECPPNYGRPSHWDLMLESGDSLRTWALVELPRAWQMARFYTASLFPACAAAAQDNIVEAKPLGNHRRDYLHYEGRLSGERGRVTRIDSGDFETLADSTHQCLVELGGQHLRGQMTLTTDTNSRTWTLTCAGRD